MARIKGLILCLLLMATMTVCAWAGENIVIFEIGQGADIRAITQAYEGNVLDSLGNNTYLCKVKRLTPKNPVSGVVSMESDALVGPSRAKGGVVSLSASSSSDWYRDQPAFQIVRSDTARLLSTGKGLTIADINSAVDYSHPALRGHLTAGYDFVIDRPSDFTLNQSSASFLDQSSASFLDQSSASFLDQSSASFLDQSTASFLDQSTASFLDQSSASFLDATNPAHGHGTMVAGILAALAPDAMIMPIRAFDDNGNADHFTIAKAIRWAVDHGADVINMSFGTLENSKILKDAIEYGHRNGVTMIASAGNENTDEPQYPAAFDKVVSIAATNLRDMKAPFSNYGSFVDVAAPGVSIITAYPGGYYAVVSGTSFSTPIVAAEAALLRDVRQKENVKDPIKKGTVKIDHRNPGLKLGEGRVDIGMALRRK
jgi:subtilisin family serine protease